MKMRGKKTGKRAFNQFIHIFAEIKAGFMQGILT